jgi:predicted Zn-dependent peptidase
MPQVRSVTVGIWVKTGSRVERAELSGISHFIEHMLFKGTVHRTAEEIAREVDSVGGYLDAFTAKEMTAFTAKVMDEHLPRALDILSDLVLAPLLRAEDIHKEQGVILEEIKMEEDNPEYLVHEIFTQNFWRDHPLGKPIIGTRETVKGFDRPAVVDFFERWYRPEHILVAAAGHLEHQGFAALVEEKLGGLTRLRSAPKPNQEAGGPVEGDRAPRPQAHLSSRNKRDLEQVHICLGVPCYPLPHEKRFATAVLNTILGGGMSSRLFQNVREKQGLAYAIFSDLNTYRDAGCLSVYAGTGRERARQVVRLIMDEFCRLKRDPVSREELRRAKDNLKGGMMLALESTNARMSNLARQEIYFQRFHSLDEILASVEAVTGGELQQLAGEFFQPDQVGVTVLGNLDGLRISREELRC